MGSIYNKANIEKGGVFRWEFVTLYRKKELMFEKVWGKKICRAKTEYAVWET